MNGWLIGACAYLFGGWVLLVADAKLHRDELAGLLGWPVMIPLGLAIRTWRRHRATCPQCGLRYGSRDGSADAGVVTT